MKYKWLGSLSIRSETFRKVTQMILTLSRSRFGNYESTIFKLREQTDSEIQQDVTNRYFRYSIEIERNRS